jgi:RNA polymerase sigma factor (sigma-70 family)
MADTTSRPIPPILRRAFEDPLLKICPDRELLQRFLGANDEAAFEAILRRHGPMVLDVCRALLPNEADADDAFQAAFLILARKAASIRRTDTLGGWLHSVAYRTALKARADFARRRKHETRVRRHEAAGSEDTTWGEARRILHEELSRLSERHRAPLVLCYLQGKTQDQAGALLGMSKGTVKRRLERGRALLRKRLVRRGLGSAAVLFAASWPGASAAVPPALSRAAHAVRLFAAGDKSAAASVSPRAVVLAGGHQGALLATTLKLVAAAALVVTLGAVGLSLGQGEAAKPAPKAAHAVPQVPAAPARTDRQGDPLPPQAVARLGTERFRSDSWVEHAAVVSGGKQLLGLGAKSVLLWDAATGKEVRRFEAPARVESFAVSPDGKLLAAGTVDHDRRNECPILLFELASGRKLGEWPGHKRDMWSANYALAFVTPTLLVSAGADRSVRVWDVTAKREVGRLPKPDDLSIFTLVPLSDGKHVLGTGAEKESGSWTVWDVHTRQRVHHEGGLPGSFVRAALSPDGKALAVTVGVGKVQEEGGYNEVLLYSAADWKERRRWRTHAGRFPQRNAVAFAPDGRTIATGGADQKVRRWDVASGKEIGLPIEPYSYANHVTYLDAGTLLTFDAQHAVKLWDAASGKPKLQFVGSETHLTALAYSPDGRHVVSGGGGGDATLRVWEVASGKQVAHLRAGMADVTCVEFSPDGQRIASADSHGVARIWDWAGGREIRALGEHKPWLKCVAFSPDGRRLATGDEGGVVRVWEGSSGKLEFTLSGHSGGVAALAFAPDGRTLVSGGWDHSIRHWDLATGKEIRVIKGVQALTRQGPPVGHTGVVTGVAFSPRGLWLYSGSYDHTICVWETESGRLARVLKAPSRVYSSVNTIALSRDGTCLAAALGDEGQESFVHVWDVPTGAKVAALRGHRGTVTRLAFSPDGRRLASASGDTTVLVWDVTGLRAKRAAEDARATDTLWDDLRGDPEAAYAAACRAVRTGDAAVAVLATRLKPIKAVAEGKVAEWVRQFDARVFADRERASRALADLGPGVEPLLRKMAAAATSEEVRARLERVIGLFAADNRRSARAVEALEMIGTREARRLLASLAGGAADARLTREAAAALQRLQARP